MLDLLMILLALGLFAVSAVYVRACERLVDGDAHAETDRGGS